MIEDEGSMEKIPMTAAGYTVLENELKHRQQVERPRIIQQITDARTHGDLSENAEYHAARERQSFIEGRMLELEDKLARAEIIDISQQSGTTVKFGARVKLVDEETDEEVVYQVVGSEEAEIQRGLLSISAPLGRALIGREAGETVEVTTPRGTRYFEILEVACPGAIVLE
jgi:transcription elongation factor GreA